MEKFKQPASDHQWDLVLFIKEEAMKHVVSLNTRKLKKSVKDGGCGECMTSCQSACKTSCGVANQACVNKEAR